MVIKRECSKINALSTEEHFPDLAVKVFYFRLCGDVFKCDWAARYPNKSFYKFHCKLRDLSNVNSATLKYKIYGAEMKFHLACHSFCTKSLFDTA